MESDAQKKRVLAWRDPMSKTLVIALVGLICLTIVCIFVIAGAIWKGNLGDGSTVGLISAIVSNMGACVSVVASRATPQQFQKNFENPNGKGSINEPS